MKDKLKNKVLLSSVLYQTLKDDNSPYINE
jgi:hypothetical protein